jgi:hypothetical protein
MVVTKKGAYDYLRAIITLMHIEIEFVGTVELQAAQYMECLETVQEWSRINDVECQITWHNSSLYIRMQHRDDYLLWIATAKMAYTFHHELVDVTVL